MLLKTIKTVNLRLSVFYIAVQFSQDHFLKRLSFLYCVFLWLLFLLKPRNRVKGQASLVWAHAL